MTTRRNQIAHYLIEHGHINIKETAELHNVSDETIRKDILYLEHQGIAKRVHGGAVYVKEMREMPFAQTSALKKHEKSAIAQKAVSFIQGQIVILDAGSTTLAIAKLISLKKDLTVVTNSVGIIPILSTVDDIELLLTGGEVRKISQAQVGYWTIRALQEVTADVSFIGANSISGAKGPSTSMLSEVETKQAMIHSAKKVYLVVDSSKTSLDSNYRFAEWNDFTGIITDDHIDPQFIAKVADQTEIIICPT